MSLFFVFFYIFNPCFKIVFQVSDTLKYLFSWLEVSQSLQKPQEADTITISLLHKENLRQARLGCLSEFNPQTVVLLCRALFCLCPTSVAANWDFCLHGAFFPLRVRHPINKWVRKYIVYCKGVNAVEEKLSVVMMRQNVGVQSCWVGGERLYLRGHLSRDVNWQHHVVIWGGAPLAVQRPWKKKKKNTTAWDTCSSTGASGASLGVPRRWG